jgi:hypothetical protein
MGIITFIPLVFAELFMNTNLALVNSMVIAHTLVHSRSAGKVFATNHATLLMIAVILDASSSATEKDVNLNPTKTTTPYPAKTVEPTPELATLHSEVFCIKCKLLVQEIKTLSVLYSSTISLTTLRRISQTARFLMIGAAVFQQC